MMTPLFPSCTQETFYNFYLWASVLPFNLLRCLVAILVTLPIYKRISRLINGVNHKIYGKQNGDEKTATKVNIVAISVGVAVILLLTLFALLRYFVF